MENRNNAQINLAGYLAKGNVKIKLLSPKMKIRYRRTTKEGHMRARATRPTIAMYKLQNEILKTELTKRRYGTRQLHRMVRQTSCFFPCILYPKL